MHRSRLAALTHVLTGPLTRRDVSRALVGLTLAGALPPRLGMASGKARKRRRRRRRKKGIAGSAFGASKNHCVTFDGLCSKSGVERSCFCYLTVGSGAPFCGQPTEVYDCAACGAGETCVDFSECGIVAAGCATPCPDPL